MERVLALRTLGAPQRRLLRGRRGAEVEQAEPEPVPTARATVIRAEPFAGDDEAGAWLDGLRGAEDRRTEEIDGALAVLNRALHAHRTARGDLAARDVTQGSALVVRLGFGSGEAVAEGRFQRGWEVPRGRSGVKRSMEAPDERFAAVLGGREPVLACEELVLRATADVAAGRHREAALQARIALESLLSEVPRLPEGRRAALEDDRGPVGSAANAALRGELEDDAVAAVGDAVRRMEAALRAHRLGGT